MASADDKNQRRARRVSAKIKNNESSDLEVSGLGRQGNDERKQNSNLRGVSASKNQ